MKHIFNVVSAHQHSNTWLYQMHNQPPQVGEASHVNTTRPCLGTNLAQHSAAQHAQIDCCYLATGSSDSLQPGSCWGETSNPDVGRLAGGKLVAITLAVTIQLSTWIRESYDSLPWIKQQHPARQATRNAMFMRHFESLKIRFSLFHCF